MTTHTQGPWLFGEPSSVNHNIYGDTGGLDPTLIASVPFLGDNRLPASMDIANAHLILHAPELLGMVKGYRRWLEVSNGPDLLKESVDALIAKAEGR